MSIRPRQEYRYFGRMDELSEIPVELQIAKGLDQIQQHATRLNEAQRKISTQHNSSSSTGTVAWDADLALSWERFEDPVQLHMAPEEKVDVNDLVRTDNDLLNRVGRLRSPMRRGEMAGKPQRGFYGRCLCSRGECASTKVATCGLWFLL